MSKRKARIPSIDDGFIPIKDLRVGQKVFYNDTREPYKVVSKTMKQIPVVELEGNNTKLKLSGNVFVSKDAFISKMGAQGGGFYGKNGGFE